jgi:formiminoglutamate deiminase
MALTRYFCDAAWLGGGAVATDVLVTVEGARFGRVEAGAVRPATAVHLRGLTLPGFANAHSHAFHRVLRGRSERAGSFWTWRDDMYAVASVLAPEGYYRLARAIFGEMALAGFTAVGEFHYLHHQVGGVPYDDPNVMGEALFEAATAAGVRITLLDACYLESAPGRPPEGVQTRFSDGSVDTWAARVAGLRSAASGADRRVGAAVHSLRAVPPRAAAAVAGWASAEGAPLHVHLSEQPVENDAVTAAYGASPAALLEEAGAFGPSTTAVHATHLQPAGVTALGRSGTSVCMCPSTERLLADGIGPAHALAGAGSPISLGTDCHGMIDPFEEMRGLELDERLASGARGRFAAPALVEAAAASGHASLGWPDAGRIAEGWIADLVTVSLDGPKLAGAGGDHVLERAVFAAAAADVTGVVAAGRAIVEERRHLLVGDVARELRHEIGAVVDALSAS